MKVVLDTTIHIDRILGSNKRIERIEDVISGKTLISTTYVKGEYYKNIINDFITLYNIFLQENDVKQTGCRITEKVFGRAQGRVFKLFNDLAASCDYDIEMIKDNLDNYLELLCERFLEDIEEMLDGTECSKAQAGIVYEDGVPRLDSIKCSMTAEQCRICEFWKERKNALQLLLKSNEYPEKLKEIIRDGLKDSNCYKGNHCMSLGDTVIVAETWKKRGISVCSSNKTDFQPICDALKRELYSPDYSGL